MAKNRSKLSRIVTVEGLNAPFHLDDLQHKTPHDSTKIHVYDHYAIYLFSKGCGDHSIDFMSYNYSSNTIVVVFPGQFHQIAIDKYARGSVLYFSKEVLDLKLLRKELLSYCIGLKHRLNSLQLTQSQFVEVLQLFGMIRLLKGSHNLFKQEQVFYIIKLILLKLIDFSKRKELTETEVLDSMAFLRYTNLVEEHFKEIRSVEEYAELMGVTTEKLQELSSYYNKKDALQVIDERVSLEAKRLLCHSGNTIKEIASLLQFDSSASFTHFIKSREECSPSVLRLQLTRIKGK